MSEFLFLISVNSDMIYLLLNSATPQVRFKWYFKFLCELTHDQNTLIIINGFLGPFVSARFDKTAFK